MTSRSDLNTLEMMINMGPQHPSTHGVFRMVLWVDGERIKDAECHIGYLHRGSEKLCEDELYSQIITLFDRMDYIANFNNDIGDFWEWSDQAWVPVQLSNEAYKFGVNYIIYAMTH